MITRIFTGLTLLCGLAFSGLALAQQPAPTPAPALTYALAEQAMTAALAEARANNWNLTIVVADEYGLPVMIHRMDGASARWPDRGSGRRRDLRRRRARHAWRRAHWRRYLQRCPWHRRRAGVLEGRGGDQQLIARV